MARRARPNAPFHEPPEQGICLERHPTRPLPQRLLSASAHARRRTQAVGAVQHTDTPWTLQ